MLAISDHAVTLLYAAGWLAWWLVFVAVTLIGRK